MNLIESGIRQLWSNPSVLRAGGVVLRRHRPIVRIGKTAVVSRFADVVEVLENDASFHVAEIYAQQMERTSGAFILGIDDRDRFTRELNFLRSAVQEGDLERVRNIVATHANALLAAASAQGEIDVATGYAHKIALAVVSEYFGVKGPDDATMGRWMRTIFWDIFLNLNNSEDVANEARRSAGELHTYLDAEIAQLRDTLARTGQLPDHFLARLVRKQREFDIDDDGVRRNIGGVIVGAVDTVSKAIVNAIGELAHRPAELAAAQDAARTGDATKVAAYAFEALRFNPHNPVILRHCASDFLLARGTPREAWIRAGTRVFASNLSAMFDPEVLQSPSEFRIDRPWEHYIHFGRGAHRCFGEHYNRVSVPEAIQCLLLRPKLERAAGMAGHALYEGPFPTKLLLKI
jgi:cytochrome P450